MHNQRLETIRTEILIIGSGAGGAVTAALCAEAGRAVLMIEEGTHFTIDAMPHFSREEILAKYRNAGVTVALGPTKIAYVEGRCVGGGSEVNRGLYHRTPGYVLDRWRREFAVEQLTSEAMEPHFEACEQTARVEYVPPPVPLSSSRLRDGAARLGWSAIEAPRLYHYDADRPPGRKQSMTETFVPRFLAAGGRLQSDTRATRLTRSASKWRVAAVHRTAGQAPRPLEIIAETVFVACGAVQTPALLRRSGISRNIGNSLRFHPMLKAVALFADEVNRPNDVDPVHQIKHFEPRFGIGCSISTPAMLALALADRPELLSKIATDWRRMGIYYVQNTGGQARVRNLPGFADPLVTVDYAKEDMAEMTEGLGRMSEALLAGGARAVYPVVAGLPPLQCTADIRALPERLSTRQANLTSVHVFSSCPMGENLARCAADSFGRVHGIDSLYIADASLLCTPTVANPQGTVMAIAHRNAVHAVDARFK